MTNVQKSAKIFTENSPKQELRQLLPRAFTRIYKKRKNPAILQIYFDHVNQKIRTQGGKRMNLE